MNRDSSQTSSGPRDAAHTDWRTLFVLALVLAVTQLGYYLTAAALPLYMHDHGVPGGRIGLDVGLGSVASVVAMFALGPVMDRIGAAVFLRLSGVLYVAAAIGMFLLPYELPIAIFRVLQGVGALTVPAAMALAARLVPQRPGTALGTMGAVNGVALAIGPPVGLSLYLGSGAAALFLGAGAAGVVGLMCSFLIPPHTPSAHRARGFGFNRVWTPILLVNALSAMYFGGIIAYLPLFLQQAHGPNAGIFFTADAIGVLLLRIPTGLLADRHGSLLPKLLGVALTLPGIACLALAPSIPALAASGALTGIGAGLFITGVNADLARLSTDANRGTALSMGTAFFSGAIFIGSAVSGILYSARGWDAILVFGLVTCLAAVPFVFVPERSQQTA